MHALLALWSLAAADAPAPPAPDPWEGWLTHFAIDGSVGTAVPLSLGAELHVEGPLGVFVDGGIGVMPPPYFQLINTTVVALGGYDQATADFLAGSLEDAMVVRLGGGIRPLPFLGLELHGGWLYARGWGTVSTTETVELLTGHYPAALERLDLDLPVETALHGFIVGARYRFVLFDYLSVALELDYVQAITGDSRIVEEQVSLSGGARAQAAEAAAIDELSDALDQYLDDTYATWVKAPVIGVTVGGHFEL